MCNEGNLQKCVGQGTRSPETILPIHAFLRNMAPKLLYLLTICTGSAVVAQTGLLDYRNATSNKRAWKWVVENGVEVNWVQRARWVVDDPEHREGGGGNDCGGAGCRGGVAETAKHVPIWSSSGVAAGIDMTFAFVKHLYGSEIADGLANSLEYERHLDSSLDPFAELWGVPGADKVKE